jgi:hypothetical protein
VARQAEEKANLSRRRTRPSLLLPGFLVIVGLVGFTLVIWGQTSSASPSVGASRSGSTSSCSVTLTVNSAGTAITATIHSGCTGGNWYLSSYEAQSATYATSFPQYFYRTTNHAPWTVALPYDVGNCFWQADFAQLSAPPPQPRTVLHYVTGMLGGSACPVATTTTTTTVPSTTTPSTVPKTTTVPSTTTPSTVPKTTTVPSTTTTVSAHSTTTVTGGTTTTTAVPGAAPGSGAPGAAPGAAPAAGSAPQSLAFTGFVAAVLLFVAITLIGCGMAVVRMGRGRDEPAELL